jgi:two-component system chemotaxis response regulator CheY
MLKLLLVEDSPLIRKATRMALPSADYEIQEAENGVAAMAVLATHQQPFDAIILDLRMPDMDGVTFLRALRQRDRHKHTPVIVATSEEETSLLVKEARKLGPADVLRKPWKPSDLERAVRQAAVLRPPPTSPA